MNGGNPRVGFLQEGQLHNHELGSVVDFGAAMTILENKARRSILEMLVREPHYPLQISKHLDISQQAVMKHLKVLEEAGFVESERVKSDRGGPPKRIFSVKQSFSLRLDLGPDLFRAEHRALPRGGPVRLSSHLPPSAKKIAREIGGRRKFDLAEALELVSQLNNSLEELDAQRDALIALHQQVMNRVSDTVDEHFHEYEERSLVHHLLEQPDRPVDLDLWSQTLRLEVPEADAIITEVRERMMFEIATSTRRVMIAGRKTPLPWWAALGGDD